MRASRVWMILVIASTLAAGASLGIVGDRLFSSDADGKPSESKRSRGLWFPCERADRGSEAAAQAGRGQGEKKGRSDRSEWRERRLADLREELVLDDRQVEQFREILLSHGRLARDFWKTTEAEYCAMRERMRDDARALLRPDQLPRFEERLRRLDERAAARSESSRRRGSDRDREARG